MYMHTHTEYCIYWSCTYRREDCGSFAPWYARMNKKQTGCTREANQDYPSYTPLEQEPAA